MNASGTHLVCGHKVANEQEDAHDDVLSDGDDVRSRDLEDLDLFLDGSVEVDVVRADTSRDADLEILGLFWDDVISASVDVATILSFDYD